jgi:hypothetical protein
MKGFTKQIAKRSTIADFNRFHRFTRRAAANFLPEFHYAPIDRMQSHMAYGDGCARYFNNGAGAFNNCIKRQNPEFD